MTANQSTHVAMQLAGVTPFPYRTFDDGTGVWVYAMLLGAARLCIGPADDLTGFERAYCYESLAAAFAAADEWDGTGEPRGWTRDIQTGRRRIAGDLSTEYVLK